MILLGIDIGGTNIKLGIIESENAEILASCSFPFNKELGYKGICKEIKEKAYELGNGSGIMIENITAVGAAVPGSLDPEGSIVFNAYNLGFKDTPLLEELSLNFENKAVCVANDAYSAAFAELKMGALKGASTAVFITLGTGLGGGLILNGEVFKGGRGKGSELGHMILDCYGNKCTCGNIGCAETLCSATWLAEQGKSAVKAYPESLIALRSGSDAERVNAKLVIDAARAGDTAAIRIFNEFLDNLSSYIASICNMIDPEIIAVGGGISSSGDILFIPLEIKVNDKTFFEEDYKVVPALMGNDAGIIGAAMLAYEEAGDKNEIQK